MTSEHLLLGFVYHLGLTLRIYMYIVHFVALHHGRNLHGHQQYLCNIAFNTLGLLLSLSNILLNLEIAGLASTNFSNLKNLVTGYIKKLKT